MSSTAGQLDFDRMRQAIESRDSAALASFYAPDADLTMVDHQNTPSNPQRLQGSDAIRALFDDICGRDMTHEVTHAVVGPDGVAYTEECVYPDGTRVLLASVLDVRDGQIVHQEGVQAWDMPADQGPQAG
jgi:hypothetical protein